MSDPIDLEAERLRRARLVAEREESEEHEQFESSVDQIIDAMVDTPLSLGEMLTAACVAMIDLLEINGYSRADAIRTVAEKIGLFRAKKVK
jgi:hypothetical protein